MNDSLDDNEKVYLNESKEKSKDIESHPAYFILSYALGNHKIENVVITRLRLSTSLINCSLGEASLSLYEKIWEKIEGLIFFENTQNCFAYISATKYRSEAVLYSKRSAGYPLSPHIKTIAVAFIPAE